jgi:Bacterial SH3 domain
MTDLTTLTSWLEGLGLEVKDGSGPAGKQLSVKVAGEADPSVVVQQGSSDTWEIVHDRRVPAATLTSDWSAPWDTGPPAEVVGKAAREVAFGFPLVESETRQEGGNVTVRFHAPVFDDGLTRQAFVLTVSAVLKVADVFDLVLKGRAEEMKGWREFEAGSEERKQQQEELITRLVEVPGPDEVPAPVETTDPVAPIATTRASEQTLPGAAWSATHTVTRRARAWAQPDPASARAGELKRRVPVQVIERQGEWARVVTSNGWSGWIDGRDLKAR